MTTLKYFITSKAKRNLLKFFLTDIDASYYTREAARLTGEPLNAVRRELGYLENAGLLRSRMQGNLKYYEIVRSFPFLAEWRRIILETTDFHFDVEEAASPAVQADIVAPPGIVTALPSPAITAPAAVIGPPGLVIANTAKQSPESGPFPIPQPGAPLTLDAVIDHLRKKFNDVNSITLAVVHGEAARSEKLPADGIELLIVGDINKDVLLELVADLEVTMEIDISLMHLTTSSFDYRNAQGDPFVRRIWGEKKLVVKGRH
jgi:DNA-binding transcriptional ArsR family regulator